MTAVDRSGVLSGTAPEPPPEGPPALSPAALGRWSWRQLTSMRTALILLFLLAAAAVPGSVVPQRSLDAAGVSRWRAEHPTLAPVYDALGLFSVYDSVWFSAIYLLLMVSLVGCIIPRTRVYLRALRAQPPPVPRHLDRLPAYTLLETADDAGAALRRAERLLRRGRRPGDDAEPGRSPRPAPQAATATQRRRRRHRVVVVAGEGGEGALSAERGRLREAGNLLFHVAVVVALVGFAAGQLLGYKGGAIILVGQGFANSLTQYDEFVPGSLFDPEDLTPMSFTVEDFSVSFATSGPTLGQPLDFAAELTYREAPDAEPRSYRLRVNHPLELDGVSVFLIGHGYAPLITVTDGNGDVAFEGPAVFLPQDPSFASFGVVKVPDARPEQLAFDGFFFPTYGFTMERGPFSQFPDWLDPRVSLLGYRGDLGMDDGDPQSVYAIDEEGTRIIQRPGAEADDPAGTDLRINLRPGEGVTLPDGLGTVELNGVQRWVRVQISHTPGRALALAGVLLALVGLMGSLFVRPRRLWVRVSRRDGRTVVEVAGLDRTSAGEGLEDEVAEVARQVAGAQEAQERR